MTALASIEQDPAGEAGFTLLELMIAMTLLALLTVALFGGLKFGSQVWAASEAKTAGTDKIIAVQSLLSEEIARAYPLFLTTDPTDAHVAFDGSRETMTFLSADPNRSGAMLRIDMQAHHDADATRLTVRARPELADNTSEQVLADLPGLASVAFAYFGAEDGKSAAGWHASWQDRKHLPALIRITARFAPRAHLNWPTLIVAPRIAADAGCSIDLLTKDCQGR